MTMHIVHKGVTSQQYVLNIAGNKVVLGANSRTASYPDTARGDLEFAVGSFAATGDLDILYDGLFYLDSAAIGTGTSVTATITGLLSTDIILGVWQRVANGGSVVPIAFGSPGSGTLPLTYAVTNGGSGIVRVLVQRP